MVMVRTSIVGSEVEMLLNVLQSTYQKTMMNARSIGNPTLMALLVKRDAETLQMVVTFPGLLLCHLVHSVKRQIGMDRISTQGR